MKKQISRIHCALPCLGIETPVLFVTSDNLEKGRTRGTGRLRGIEDFFHIIRYTSNELVVESSELIKILGGGKISSNLSFTNSDKYKSFAQNLIEKTTEFANEYQ